MERPKSAGVAELADALDSKSSVRNGREGSSPSSGTLLLGDKTSERRNVRRFLGAAPRLFLAMSGRCHDDAVTQNKGHLRDIR